MMCSMIGALRSSAPVRAPEAPAGEPLSLYKHQKQALASQGLSYVVTTGTGSGKSPCFFIPPPQPHEEWNRRGDRIYRR